MGKFEMPRVHSFVICKEADLDWKTKRWFLKDVVWQLNDFDFVEDSIDLVAYYALSGGDVELSVRVIEAEGETPIWTMPDPIQIGDGFPGFKEGKMILRSVKFPAIDPLIGFGEYRFTLLLDGIETKAFHDLSKY
jgi:hypothetical protein